jgi:HPt (histidine-containing phosphotransfer) domain-containing protein
VKPEPVAPAPQPRSDEPEEPPVDFERLSELAGGDEAGIRELTDLYLTQTTEQLSSLKAAVDAGTLQEIERIAHKSAGASATCGMNAIVPALRELERQGREGKLSGATALAEQATKELERIRAFLDNRQRSAGNTPAGAGSS